MVVGVGLLFVTSIVAVVSAAPDRSDATSAHDRCSANAGAALISMTTSAAVVRANGLKAMIMTYLSARLSREMLADKLAKVAIDRSIVEDSLTADHSAATALFDSSGHMIARCGWRSLRRLRRLGLGCYG